MSKKYELVPVKDGSDSCYFRVRALKSFADVKEGDLGGFVSNEFNLSQLGDCWIYGLGKVLDEAMITDNVRVEDNATVQDNAFITGNVKIQMLATVGGNSEIKGDVIITEEAEIDGNAKVTDSAVIKGMSGVSGDAWVYGNAKLSLCSTVSGNARVGGNTVLEGDVYVSGDSCVEGDVYLGDGVYIGGKTYISGKTVIKNGLVALGNTRITENGYLVDSNDLFTLNFNLRFDDYHEDYGDSVTVTAYRTLGGDVFVDIYDVFDYRKSLFLGSVDEFTDYESLTILKEKYKYDKNFHDLLVSFIKQATNK